MALFLLDLPRKTVDLEAICFSLDPSRQRLDARVHRTYPKEIVMFYEEHAKNARPKHDPENNPILALKEFRIDQGQRSFDLRCVEFNDYHALKKLLYQHRNDDPLLLQQFVVLSMIAVLETADDHLVLGHRGGEHLPNRYLPPAGFQECPGIITSEYFAEKCKEEFREEVGIDFDGKISYIGLTGDTRDSFLDVSVFYGRTPLNCAEVQKAWERNGSKTEHKHLIYIPSAPSDVTRFLRGRYSGVVNPFMDIVFEKGRCICGPEEVKGRDYQQIENGVGALAAYLSLKVQPDDLRARLSRLSPLDVIEDVVEKDLANSDSVFLC